MIEDESHHHLLPRNNLELWNVSSGPVAMPMQDIKISIQNLTCTHLANKKIETTFFD